MKIATFNINGIKARGPRLIEWLEETRPAVACLQEIKTQDEGFPAADFEALGYSAIWHGQKSFNGVAILVDTQAGHTLTEVRRGLGIPGPNEGDEEQARFALEEEAAGAGQRPVVVEGRDPGGGQRMAAQIRVVAVVVQACRLLQFLEHAHKALRIKTGLGMHIEAQAVGFALHVT